MARFALNVALLSAAAFAVYMFRVPLHAVYTQALSEALPCRAPIEYSIALLDERFGLSEEDLKAVLAEAERVWEELSGLDLFAYDPGGDLKISLMYDERQATTEKLRELDGVVDQSLAAYEEKRRAFEALRGEYFKERAAFSSDADAFEIRQTEYAASVKYWNDRGGAPPAEYRELQERKASLERELSALKQRERALNAQADRINELVPQLNATARDLNLNVARYNSVGKAVPTEFEEGMYIESFGERSIEVYEFASREKLIRVIAHEFGHALGLDHVADESAIMYEINRGDARAATASDIAELTRRCGVSH